MKHVERKSDGMQPAPRHSRTANVGASPGEGPRTCPTSDAPVRDKASAERQRQGTHRFLADVLMRLEALEARNADALDRTTALIWQALQGEGLVHVTGAGHSTLFALEAFYRAGGLAAVNPIWHPALLPLMGARTSTFAERLSGLGAELVRAARVCQDDVVIIFSSSGVNPVPVELAEAARSAGASVVAVVSLDHSRAVPSRHPAGLRLGDVADVVIDTGAPVGDAGYVASPGARPVAPLSTILGAYVWDALLVRLADCAAVADVELPVWASSNVPGGDESTDEMMSRFVERIQAL
jgi:uncharacterized phosphosugar-binding protein